MKILIMGLSGSGKTTLANQLVSILPESVHLNADKIRTQFNDWDFSIDGRFRQCNRIKFLAEQIDSKYVVCDFIAPTHNIRNLFNADFTIFLDTCLFCKYRNTNHLFEPPTIYDIRVTSLDAVYWANHISNYILAQHLNI